MASLTRAAFQRAALNRLFPSASSASATLPATLASLQQLRGSQFHSPRRAFASGDKNSKDKGKLNDNGSSKPEDSTPVASENDLSSPPAPRPPLQLKRERQTFASLDFSPEEQPEASSAKLLTDGSSSSASAQPRQRTGARSARDSLSSIERRRRRMGWASAVGLLGVLGGGWVWLGWEEDAEGQQGVWAWISRSNRNALKMFDMFDKPIWEKLLPDPLPEGYQRPYTLVLSIDDLLVASTWDRQNGWRTAKRPGVDYFLSYLSQFYEIVIFTTQSSNTSISIIEALDPFSFSIMYHLFREATRTHKAVLVKDLSYLNRDLSKVIALDTVKERYMLQDDNLIEVGKWKPGKKGNGDKGDGDGGLVALIPFLESIAIFGVPDVRPVLAHYRGKDVALEWAKVEAENKARFVEEWETKQAQAGGLASGRWTMGKLLGNTPKTPVIPQTLLEIRRAEAQRVHKQEQEFLEKNREELQKQKEKAQEEGMKAMMEGGMFGVLSRMGLGPPPTNPQGSPGSGAESAPAASAATSTGAGATSKA